MGRTFFFRACFLTVYLACQGRAAPIFQDNFDSAHDFITQGLINTGWDGMEGRDRAVRASSSLDHPGQLILSSSGPIGPAYGVFLYKTVTPSTPNFIATVKISDIANRPDFVIPGSHGGLLIRAGQGSQAGQGEDWLGLDYAPSESNGNGIRQADNGNPELICSNSRGWFLDPYLQIEKEGALFHCRTSRDGEQWEDTCSPISREDLNDISLQVGLYVSSTSQGAGYIAFDAFSITNANSDGHQQLLEAHSPNPTVGSTETTASVLSWEPGRTAVFHQVWLGVTPQSLVLISDELTQSWLFYEPGFQPGTTYYWRVDEVTSTGDLITGELWHFSIPAPEAHRPEPVDGQTDVIENNLTLSWNAGLGAIWYEVYFSRNRQDVVSGLTSAWKGHFTHTTTTSTYMPEHLEGQITYYWRVDEINLNGQTHPGPVWSFTTMVSIPVLDSTLKAKWSFDEGGGSTVIDSSGFRHHGRLFGDPMYVDGIEGSALDFDGIDDYAVCAGGSLPAGQSEFTLAAWICPSVHSHTLMAWGLPQPGRANELRLTGGDRCRHTFWGNTIEFETGPLTDEWHHLALVYNGSTRYAFVDGVRKLGTLLQSTGNTPNVGRSEITIGTSPWMNDYFAGKIDEVYIYEDGLSRAEIQALADSPRLMAKNPIPENGSVVESINQLEWESDSQALSYDIYLGQNPDAVRQATPSDVSGLYQGRRSLKWIPIDITPGTEQVYYWRVDIISNTATTRGHLWSFQTANVGFIDDFESYTAVSPNRIYQTWIDGGGFTDPFEVAGNGSGAIVGYIDPPYVETGTVYRGRQAMPIFFNNVTAPFYSQVSRSFDTPQDWQEDNFHTLCLYFFGRSDNWTTSADKLSVIVVDDEGQWASALYAGPRSHLSDGRWHSWRISLNSLDTINLSAVTELRIRIGDPDNAGSGGNGVLIVDDICLSSAF